MNGLSRFIVTTGIQWLFLNQLNQTKEGYEMKHWEIEHNGDHIRIEWNEGGTFNLQTPIGGEWVDYHCFTCYGIETDHEALECAMDLLNNATDELI